MTDSGDRPGALIPNSYQTPNHFVDDLMHLWRCVEALGGYDYLCRSEEPMADRAHFIRIYDQIVERERQTARMLPEVRELRARLAAGQAQYLGAGDE